MIERSSRIVLGWIGIHSLAVSSAPAAVNGFQISFDVLGGLLVAALIVAAVFLRPARARVEEVEVVQLEEAA